MKADERLKRIPVVMLTTSVVPEDVSKAYSLFASSYVVKAVGFADFVRQIESFVAFWTKESLVELADTYFGGGDLSRQAQGLNGETPRGLFNPSLH